eukprot:scaffold207_cov409-Prasinococcus_capsulatus_cf.AAC.24
MIPESDCEEARGSICRSVLPPMRSIQLDLSDRGLHLLLGLQIPERIVGASPATGISSGPGPSTLAGVPWDRLCSPTSSCVLGADRPKPGLGWGRGEDVS